MFGSLRLRLPAIFLAGVALAGLVASLISIRLFQDYARSQTLGELRREAAGLAEIYGHRAAAVPIPRDALERATGDRLFFAGDVDVEFLARKEAGSIALLERLPSSAVPSAALEEDGLITFEFVPPHEDRTFLAVATPLKVEGLRFGALVVAKPKTELRATWLTLLERLALAFLGGVLVAGALGWYLSRRITRPVLALSRAADEVAAGRLDVAVPAVGGRDEIAHLAERFGQMAERLRETEERERNFLVSVSHELRTPLTAIAGHVAALREGVVEDPELRAESLDVVAEETRRLERLVGDILDLAKLDAHRFTVRDEEVDMQRLVERAYSGFAEEARRRAIDFRRALRADAVIESDGDRVLQIISNLLENAFRWTPDGGRVDLELDATNGHVSVAVEDTGPGIARDEQERIFRPFWSRDGQGTGLGLPIARELAHALGGRIELDSEQGRGSRFVLVLPAERGRVRSARPGGGRAPAGVARGSRSRPVAQRRA